MKATKVKLAIVNGEFSEAELRSISHACWEHIKADRRTRALVNANTLKPGTKVQVIMGIKPQYMVGHVGQIAMPPENSTRQMKAGFIWVDFGRRIQGPQRAGSTVRRTWGPMICMPANCLQEVK